MTPDSSRPRSAAVRALCGRAVWLALVLLALPTVPRALSAQALTSITSLYVTYSSRKVTANPTGELKAKLDSVDQALQIASRLGQSSQVRRLLAKGNTLLSGRPWTDAADFNNSLLLRSEKSLVESQSPMTVRLEQLYAPSIELARALTARATLTTRTPGAPLNSAPTVVKSFGAMVGVPRDLREAPFQMEFDIRDVPDGRYVLAVDVMDSARTLGSATLNLVVRKGLEETVRTLENAAARAPASLKAELLFPVDRMRKVNRGELELRTWDSAKDFATADSMLAAVAKKKDPFAGRTGDMKRHYMLDSAREVMPYRLYVPRAYSAKTPMPVIVALHGLGSTEDTFFDAYGKKLPELAEQYGYIVVSPLGFRVDGGYGSGVATPPSDPAARRSSDLSELDVMQALAQVRALYNIDADRMYLMGHSMGAIGTWKVAAKYPTMWAAIGLFAGQGAPSTIPLIKHIPAFVVHGDNDPTVNVRGSRTMVEAMKAQSVDYVYIEVPGGNHSNVVEPNFEGMMKFFDARKRIRVTQ
jgi:poly(3-hydroxybutyrate) depolymerase